jgi:Flp pilus assembly protein TadG
MGIAIVLFILLVGGVMQFGHAFMVANSITQAARDGARLAASWADRGACQQLQNTNAIVTNVNNQIATVTAVTFTVNVSQTPAVGASATPPCAAAGTTPTVNVNVNGCVPYIFNILGLGDATCSGGFAVNRTVTFADELRVGS